MYCVQCQSKVSVAGKSCPNCKADLLKFGATTSSLPDKGHRPAAEGLIGIKKVFWGELWEDLASQTKSADALEVAILKPLLDDIMTRLRVQYESDAQIEKVFDTQVLPAVVRLKEDRDTSELLREVDDLIQSRLGGGVFSHYEEKGDDVLRILRSGEIAVRWMDLLSQADLSVILFPFFKAVERSCCVHTAVRYGRLKGHSLLAAVAKSLPPSADYLIIEELPEWLEERKVKIIEVVRGLLTGSEFHTAGALATGVAIQLFGRTWPLKIRRTDREETKVFRIENLLTAAGGETERETLASGLQRIQYLRNQLVHEKVEENREIVEVVRGLAYDCLKALPSILRI
jgi:hypothetical protein